MDIKRVFGWLDIKFIVSSFYEMILPCVHHLSLFKEESASCICICILLKKEEQKPETELLFIHLFRLFLKTFFLSLIWTFLLFN